MPSRRPSSYTQLGRKCCTVLSSRRNATLNTCATYAVVLTLCNGVDHTHSMGAAKTLTAIHRAECGISNLPSRFEPLYRQLLRAPAWLDSPARSHTQITEHAQQLACTRSDPNSCRSCFTQAIQMRTRCTVTAEWVGSSPMGWELLAEAPG